MKSVVVKLGRIIAMLKSNLTSFACLLRWCSSTVVLFARYPNEDIDTAWTELIREQCIKLTVMTGAVVET